MRAGTVSRKQRWQWWEAPGGEARRCRGAHGPNTSVFSHSTRVFGNCTLKCICSFTPLGKPAAAPPAEAASSCLQLAPSGCRGHGDSERVGDSILQGGLGVTRSCGEGHCGSGDLGKPRESWQCSQSCSCPAPRQALLAESVYGTGRKNELGHSANFGIRAQGLARPGADIKCPGVWEEKKYRKIEIKS